jgi:hypothetical protein
MIYDFLCKNGHKREVFVHGYEDRDTADEACNLCGEPMAPVFSPGRGLLFYEEGRPRTIYNLGEKPITVTSYKQHKEAMKRAGVVEAGAMPSKNSGRVSSKGRWV